MILGVVFTAVMFSAVVVAIFVVMIMAVAVCICSEIELSFCKGLGGLVGRSAYSCTESDSCI